MPKALIMMLTRGVIAAVRFPTWVVVTRDVNVNITLRSAADIEEKKKFQIAPDGDSIRSI